MRVLVLSCATYADPATRTLWDRVAARGAEVTLAMPRLVKHPFGLTVVADTPWPTPGVRLVTLDTWFLHENGTHIMMKGVSRLIRQCRPEIVHFVMEPWSITVIEALAYIAARRRRPLVGVQAVETKLEQGSATAAAIRSLIFRHVVSRSDFFIGWSPDVVTLARRLGLDGQPSAAVPAVGVDIGLFYPAERDEKLQLRRDLRLGQDEDFCVGFAGRLVEEKGVNDLVAACDMAVREAPAVRLAILGSGPLDSALRSASATRPWMRVLSPTDRQGVAAFLRALDMFVLPSRSTRVWEEQFGLVLAEAMASGVVTAGSICGAIPHVLGDPKWLFPQSDPAAISRCIVTAATDRAMAANVGRLARSRAVERFSDEAVAGQMHQVWRSAQ